NRHLDVHMAEIAPMEALLNSHILAVPMPSGVEPTEIVETHRIHDQSVPVPFAYRISEPCPRWVVGKLAAIRENLPEDGFHFIQHQDFTRRLNNLEWLRQQISMGHAIGQALQVRAHDSRFGVLS